MRVMGSGYRGWGVGISRLRVSGVVGSAQHGTPNRTPCLYYSGYVVNVYPCSQIVCQEQSLMTKVKWLSTRLT